MTDESAQQKNGASWKAGGVNALYADFCQHLTPPLAGYLLMQFPVLGNDLSFEIVVACESVGGVLILKAQGFKFRDLIDGIIAIKNGGAELWQAIRYGNAE